VNARLAGILAASALASSVHAGSAALSVIDQQNTTGRFGIGGIVGTGVGQSFTPTLNLLNAAAFQLQVNGSGTATVELQVFDGSGFAGTLLGTSAPIIFSNTSTRPFEFIFSDPVSLDPGNVYTFCLFETSGSTSYSTLTSQTDPSPYGGGITFTALGMPLPGNDVVFAEGLTGPANTVPDSGSTFYLLGLACAAVTVLRRQLA